MKPYYQDSAVTIYHGDCRDILPQLGSFDLMFSDPPYNVRLGEQPHAVRQNGYSSHSDNLGHNEYGELLSATISKIPDCKSAFITPGNSNQTLWPKPLWTMAWVKTNGVTRTPLTRGQKMNHACWEPILVYGKLSNPPHSDVINIPIYQQAECEGHPCPKPLKLLLRLVAFTDAMTIIDPFSGSGTTGRAAKDLGRKATLIELDERYCEIAAKRMLQEVLPI